MEGVAPAGASKSSAAARELVQNDQSVDPTPDVAYFLGARLHAAIRHLASVYAMSMARPVSLVTFLPVSADAPAPKGS